MVIIKTRYSIEPRDKIYVKGYEFLSFAKSMSKNIGTHATKVAKNLRGKYSQKPLDSAKTSTTDAMKTGSKRAIQKTTGATGDLISNKIADKITGVLKSSKELHSKNDLEEAKNEIEIPTERKIYISRRKTTNY